MDCRRAKLEINSYARAMKTGEMRATTYGTLVKLDNGMDNGLLVRMEGPLFGMVDGKPQVVVSGPPIPETRTLQERESAIDDAVAGLGYSVY